MISGIVPGPDPMAIPHLIVRSDQNDSPPVLKIVGHAMLIHEYSTTQWRKFTINFDIDDFVTHVALRNHIQSRAYGVNTLESFLRTSPTQTEYSSWGVLEGARRDDWTEAGEIRRPRQPEAD